MRHAHHTNEVFSRLMSSNQCSINEGRGGGGTEGVRSQQQFQLMEGERQRSEGGGASYRQRRAASEETENRSIEERSFRVQGELATPPPASDRTLLGAYHTSPAASPGAPHACAPPDNVRVQTAIQVQPTESFA